MIHDKKPFSAYHSQRIHTQSSTRLADIHCVAIRRLLETNHALTELNLSWNPDITNKGAKHIYIGMQRNFFITNLTLTKTAATKYYLDPIEELVDRNRNHV